MKKFLFPKISWLTPFAVILGSGFLGMVFYVNYLLNSLSDQLVAKQSESKATAIILESKLRRLGEILESTLTEEQKKNEELRKALGDITNTVQTLERVAITDRDLLKKYSKTYFLNENYTPLELKVIPSKWRSPTAKNYQILSDVLPFLEGLLKASAEDGLNLLVQSAYRSFGVQSELKAAYVVTYGEGANRFSADQGYSEHQLGTTVDFTTQGSNSKLEGFDQTPEYKWLLKNAHRHGFILSYPPNNAYYKFEPWHWRFVGRDLARRLNREGINFYDMDQRVIDSYLADIFD